jgi:hypothetical protein
VKLSPVALMRSFIGLTILLGSGAIYVFVGQPAWLLQRQEFRTGNKIVSLFETYRNTHGRLPEALDEIGIRDPDIRVYYQKTGNDAYMVWFGTTLGESETYNSHTKHWK